MKMSDQGRKLLIERESLETRAYRDSEGYWTIGVGHLLSHDKNADFSSLVWTREKAEQVFAEDLAKYERAVNESIQAMPIEQHQFDALVSFAHNIGVAGVMNSWVVREINKGNWEAAEAAFDNWHKPASIISRRNGEREQFAGRAFEARIHEGVIA
jgi:lysozyme